MTTKFSTMFMVVWLTLLTLAVVAHEATLEWHEERITNIEAAVE